MVNMTAKVQEPLSKDRNCSYGKKEYLSDHVLSCVFPPQIFEWWYFRKYGTSFIEQVSVSHLRPLLGGVENSSTTGLFASVNGEAEPRPSVSGKYVHNANCHSGITHITASANNRVFLLVECKVWRNPLNLFRGAEYNRCVLILEA